MRFAAPSGRRHPLLSDRSLPHALWKVGEALAARRQPSQPPSCWSGASLPLPHLFSDAPQAAACCQPHWNHGGEIREGWTDMVGLTSSVLNAPPHSPPNAHVPSAPPPSPLDDYLTKLAVHYSSGAHKRLNTRAREKRWQPFLLCRQEGLFLPCCPLSTAAARCSPPLPPPALPSAVRITLIPARLSPAAQPARWGPACGSPRLRAQAAAALCLIHRPLSHHSPFQAEVQPFRRPPGDFFHTGPRQPRHHGPG